MSSYSSALMWMTLAAQVVAWPAVKLHDANGALTRLPANDRIVVEHLLRSQLGPMAQGEDAGQMNRAIESFRVERVILAGAPGLAVQANGENFCGASGNCSFWIVDLRQHRVVLRADAVQQFAMEQHSKSGFPDVITWTHESATEHELIRWQFIGGKYERTACATHDWSDTEGNPLPQPKTTPHPCDPEGN